MNQLLLAISILFTFNSAFAQSHSQALVDSFVNETISYYYTDFAKPLDSSAAETFKPQNPYILKSELTENLKTDFSSFTVTYLSQEQALEEIANTKDRSGRLDRILIERYPDTIDIDISGWSIRVTKVKRRNGRKIPFHASFFAGCGGTLGYIPTCRFVYDRETETWTKFTWQQIADSRMERGVD